MGICVDAKLTSKGQVTIPVEIRRALGVSDGDRVEFFVHRDGRVVLVGRRNRAVSLAGKLAHLHASEISDDEAVAQAVAERDARSLKKKRR